MNECKKNCSTIPAGPTQSQAPVEPPSITTRKRPQRNIKPVQRFHEQVFTTTNKRSRLNLTSYIDHESDDLLSVGSVASLNELTNKKKKR